MDGTALVRVDKRGKCETSGGRNPEIRCRGLAGQFNVRQRAANQGEEVPGRPLIW